MKFEIGKIYSFKLNTGEECIAKVLAVNNDWIEISDPVSIAPTGQGMSLIPTIFTADTKDIIKININTVTMYGATEDAVKNKYIEATTGISVPTKKIVLG